MTVVIDDRALQGSLRRLSRYMSRLTPVYRAASIHMRNYVRITITMQGRKTPYKTLSWWTRARTGRRKALITLRPRIKSAYDAIKAVVYFDPVSSAWHIDQHHQGYISDAVSSKRMIVPRFGGGVLAAFRSRRASKVPRREIWPSRAEVVREVKPIVANWLSRGAHKTWR